MKITPKELATKLNNRQYGEEITPEEEKLAKENNLVVVFGASDDLCELRGAINDEIGCCGNGQFLLTKEGVLVIDEDEQEVLDKFNVFEYVTEKARVIEMLWDRDGFSWVYKTDIPHETFEVLEDEGKYCRGIIFSLDEI